LPEELRKIHEDMAEQTKARERESKESRKRRRDEIIKKYINANWPTA
jgi:hypothetical protein